MDVLTATALCRAARDSGAMLLWGAGLYVAVVAPAALRPWLDGLWLPLRRGSLMMLVPVLACLLPVQAAALGDGWRDALDPATLLSLLRDTSIGTAWMAQAGALALLLGTGLLPERWRPAATAAGGGLLLSSVTLTGHAAMREGWLGAAQRAVAILHLLSGGFWFGALLPLLPTLRALPDPHRHRAASAALRRFSGLGHGAVAMVLATGILNALLILGGWPTERLSAYQDLLVAKVALVVLMTILAILNRYRFVPRLAHDPDGAIRSIRRATLGEILCGALAILLVAVFGLLEPA